ncbi:MAG: hypothetical protein ACRD3S_14715, partial [Terracidiphilus sp.]
MKLSIAAGALLIAATIGSYALAQKDACRPDGIPAGQWIPLSDRAGIVISDYQPGDETKTSQGLIRPLRVQSLPPAAPVVQRQRVSEDSARGYV